MGNINSQVYASKRNIAFVVRYVAEKNKKAMKARYGKLTYFLNKIFNKKMPVIFNIEKLFDGTTLSYSDFIKNLTESVPIEIEHLIYDNAKKLLREPDVVYNAGRVSAKNQSIGEVGTMLRVFRLWDFRNPWAMINKVDDFNKLYNNNSDAIPVKVNDKHVILNWQYYPKKVDSLNLDDCRIAQGSLEAAFEHVGFKNLRRYETKCSIRVDKLGWLNSKIYEVKDNHVIMFESDSSGNKLSNGEDIGELKLDGSFEIEGKLYGAECCDYHLEWDGLGSISEKLFNLVFGRIFTYFEVYGKLSTAYKELRENAENTERLLENRTKELHESQQQLINIEKRSLEHRITGGFAHEMRNALAGAQLEFKTTLNYQDKGKTSTELLKESATTLLKNISEIHQEYGIPRDIIASHFIPELKTIAQIADHLSETISGVSRDLDRGLSITGQIRDYAKMSEIKAGDTPVDLVSLLKRYQHQYRKEFEENKITFAVNGLDEAIVKADETHLNSIFSNLILNAKDALTDSQIDSPLISLTIEDDSNQLIVIVQDNGPGIKEEHLQDIFEPFFSTKPTSGTGLGLGIVKRLAQLYGGGIVVKSELNEGTTFYVTLNKFE